MCIYVLILPIFVPLECAAKYVLTAPLTSVNVLLAAKRVPGIKAFAVNA